MGSVGRVNYIRLTDAEIDGRMVQIARLLAEGRSRSVIGFKLGLSKGVIAGMLIRHGHRIGYAPDPAKNPIVRRVKPKPLAALSPPEPIRAIQPTFAQPPPAPTVVYPPQFNRQCQFPLWGNERTKFRPDGLPLMCYAPSHGAYCEKHRAICFTKVAA